MKKRLQGFVALFSKNARGELTSSLARAGEVTGKEVVMFPHTKKDSEEFFATFRRDVAAFKKKLPSLLEKFPGEYVAILDGEIVAHKPQWKALVDLTQEQYPDRFVLLEQVIPTTNVVIDMDTIEG